jgi:hypothetical protein
MQKQLIFFIFILGVINSINDIDTNNKCEEKFCYKFQGNCSIDNSTCVCNPQYYTYPENSVQMCTYVKKSQFLAFILETFLTFGSGHFYIGNLTIAIPKFLIWIIGYTLIISLKILSYKREDSDATVLLIQLGSCISCSIMIIWQIIDVLMFGFNNYTDLNNIELKEW